MARSWTNEAMIKFRTPQISGRMGHSLDSWGKPWTNGAELGLMVRTNGVMMKIQNSS